MINVIILLEKQEVHLCFIEKLKKNYKTKTYNVFQSIKKKWISHFTLIIGRKN